MSQIVAATAGVADKPSDATAIKTEANKVAISEFVRILRDFIYLMLGKQNENPVFAENDIILLYIIDCLAKMFLTFKTFLKNLLHQLTKNGDHRRVSMKRAGDVNP